jgi:hypothetical protein
MESLTIIPSSNSHITHSLPSSLNEPGIEANIFINRPVEEDPEYANVEPLSVYLVSVEKSQSFLPFKNSKESSLVLPLSVYISILEFFYQKWPDMKSDLEKKFKLIRRKRNPYQVNTNIHFYLSGTAYFERWFQDTFLFFKKCSTDFTPNTFHLQRGGKNIDIDPDVMFSLAQSYQGLLHILYQAGYDHPAEYEDIRS